MVVLAGCSRNPAPPSIVDRYEQQSDEIAKQDAVARAQCIKLGGVPLTKDSSLMADCRFNQKFAVIEKNAKGACWWLDDRSESLILWPARKDGMCDHSDAPEETLNGK